MRSEPEFAAGHPAGAQNVPLMSQGPTGLAPNPEFLAVVEGLYPKDAKLVLGLPLRRAIDAGDGDADRVRIHERGRSTRGLRRRARRAFGQLSEAGWQEAGLPVAMATPGGSYAELRRRAGRG